MKIEYIIGDATEPKGDGVKYIVHIVNNMGFWGKGFVLAISRKWPEVRKRYLKYFDSSGVALREILGSIQVVNVSEEINIVNLFGQHGIYKNDKGIPPIRYEAVEEGLSTLVIFAKSQNGSVHMPRMGTGLAGGSWSEIEAIINRTLISAGIPVTVYDLKE